MIFLYRSYLPDNSGVFGKLVVGDYSCYTLERPWMGNKVGESCIPEGPYGLMKRESPIVERASGGEFKGGWEVDDVPDRIYIMIHPGNYVKDTEGCILVGESLFWNNDHGPMVTNSRRTFKALMAKLSIRETWDMDIQTKTVSYP